jgi:uncharacterized protein (DUF1778 family)
MASSKTTRRRSNDDRMDVRLSRDHKALIEKAAAYSGETLTGFAVTTLVGEARRVVREHESVMLTSRDRDAFMALLDDPEGPNERLRRAARRHRALIARSE